MKLDFPSLWLLLLILCSTACQTAREDTQTETAVAPVTGAGLVWSIERANDWYGDQPWLVGTNFTPSTAINQLEFWQAETFDPATIDRELGWSAELGMNLHRVFLHNLLWEQDSAGLLSRMDQYLDLADKYDIKTMFVLFDDVWHPVPKLGDQPDPMPHVHNSGWVQAPGVEILRDTTRHDELERYVKGVIGHFANDERVLVWDLYNEPDNEAGQPGRRELELQNKENYSLPLVRKVFAWAREVNPSQPLTVGLWQRDIEEWDDPEDMRPLERFMVENSDVISFHAYDSRETVARKIEALKNFNRPLFCTEYMARTHQNNTFQTILPLLKENNIAAINWGFVSGKTNTIYPWRSWDSTFTAEPAVWFHDILRPDGTPYQQAEVELIKSLTKEK